MADPFKVAAEIALADTSQEELPEGRIGYRPSDNLDGALKSLAEGWNVLSDIDGDGYSEFGHIDTTEASPMDLTEGLLIPADPDKGQLLSSIEYELRQEYTGLSDMFAVANADGEVSMEESIAFLSRVGGESIEMTAQDMQNALDGLNAMGIDPNGNTEALIGMAKLIETATAIEHRLQPGGYQPETTPDIKPPVFKPDRHYTACLCNLELHKMDCRYFFENLQ